MIKKKDMKQTTEQLKELTREELFVFAAEANSKNDQELLDMITDELKERNKSNEK